MMQLRPYQRAAVDAGWNYMRAKPGNPCIVLPTGSGKTLVMADIVRHALTEWPGTRIGVLAHTRELVSQNADKLRSYWPEAPIGIYAAGLNRRDRFEPVIFGSIQSVANKAMQLGRFDLLLIDECHRIPLAGDGQYREFIEGCSRANPDLRVMGLTATAYRLGGGPVCHRDYLLNDIAYEANIRDLIEQGYLCRLVGKNGGVHANLDGVHTRNGEYVAGELERACNVQAIVEAACDEMVELCADRHSWVVFCAGIEHAANVTEALTRRGIACASVDSHTPSGVRDARIAAFQCGALRALVNVNVLSEGFDAPHIDAIIMMRPTKSAGMYYQQVGRALRLHPSKSDALVLDYAGNVLEHGPIDAIRPPKKPGQKTSSGAPVRACPSCKSHVPVQARTCPDCGFLFPTVESAPHDETASDAPILSSDEPLEPVAYPVLGVRYSRHEKKGKTPSMRVTYACGLRTFSDWICIEHGGMPRARAMSWWMRHDPTGLTPRTVDAALEASSRLKTPARVLIKDGKPYPEVLGVEFA